MPVKQNIPYRSGMFFITFTCYKWLTLIDTAEAYPSVYNWFDHLKSKGHFINGFVIMPNHVHAIISFTDTGQRINTIIGNGKRFIAYDIIENLERQANLLLLDQLSQEVEAKRKANNKAHNVWELSFDWKECRDKKFIAQKLDYIHNNPCSKKWNLCEKPSDYIHSSARYYIEGKDELYPVTNFMEMDDIAFIN